MDYYRQQAHFVLMMTRLSPFTCVRVDTTCGWEIIADTSNQSIFHSNPLTPNFGPGISNKWLASIYPQWSHTFAKKPDEKRFIVCRSQVNKQIGLVAHSQGAAIAFLALARDQVPEVGNSLSCFIALTPAVYSGTLLRSFSFSFVRIMSTRIYRMCFGIHSFIPFMMVMHRLTPGPVYGWLGYRVFNYLFSWTDLNWELRLRNRFFQFSPVFVSAECMRWWLGKGIPPDLRNNKDSFVRQKCILPDTSLKWYDSETMPPVSIYVGGRDKLVEGEKLIDRFEQVETDIAVIRTQIDEDYEHLDCLWSMDCIERVGVRVKEDIWSTTWEEDIIVPEGCRKEDQGIRAPFQRTQVT